MTIQFIMYILPLAFGTADWPNCASFKVCLKTLWGPVVLLEILL